MPDLAAVDTRANHPLPSPSSLRAPPGVSERVVMTVIGHTTRAVFGRYHTVSPAERTSGTYLRF